MPYIVTTKRPTVGYDVTAGQEPITERGEVVSRRAVATLDEARSDVRAIALDHNSIGAAQKSRTLPEAGGTVGPLPDGTVMEVKRVGWANLASAAGRTRATIPPDPSARRPGQGQAEILEAFNAQEATR